MSNAAPRLVAAIPKLASLDLARTLAFFERVRNGYLARAAAEPGRFRIIDSTRPVADVRAELGRIAEQL